MTSPEESRKGDSCEGPNFHVSSNLVQGECACEVVFSDLLTKQSPWESLAHTGALSAPDEWKFLKQRCLNLEWSESLGTPDWWSMGCGKCLLFHRTAKEQQKLSTSIYLLSAFLLMQQHFAVLLHVFWCNYCTIRVFITLVSVFLQQLNGIFTLPRHSWCAWGRISAERNPPQRQPQHFLSLSGGLGSAGTWFFPPRAER